MKRDPRYFNASTAANTLHQKIFSILALVKNRLKADAVPFFSWNKNKQEKV